MFPFLNGWKREGVDGGEGRGWRRDVCWVDKGGLFWGGEEKGGGRKGVYGGLVGGSRGEWRGRGRGMRGGEEGAEGVLGGAREYAGLRRGMVVSLL